MSLNSLILLICIALYVPDLDAEEIPSTDAGTNTAQPQWLDDKHKRDFESRAQSIDALLLAFRSAAQEAGNGDHIGTVERELAQQLAKAQQQYERGDYAAGRETLDQAYAMVKSALVEVRDGDTVVSGRRSDDQYEVKAGEPKAQLGYEERIESIETLMAAYRRVAEEKGELGRASLVEDNVAAMVAKAETHVEAGDYGAGLPLLNDAYVVVKESLAALRDGDTLVRSLNFANKQEEYQYYVAKTNSQITALRILQQNGADSSKAARLKNLLASVQSKLDHAGALAAENDHEEAVSIMDDVLTRLQSGLMMFFSSR